MLVTDDEDRVWFRTHPNPTQAFSPIRSKIAFKRLRAKDLHLISTPGRFPRKRIPTVTQHNLHSISAAPRFLHIVTNQERGDSAAELTVARRRVDSSALGYVFPPICAH